MPMQTNWYSRGTFFRPQPDQKVDKKSNNLEFEFMNSQFKPIQCFVNS